MNNKTIIPVLVYCLIWAISPQRGFSQLKGERLLGATGLDAGTQAPAQTLSVLVPLYFYNTSDLRNAGGNKLTPSPDFTMFLTGVGGNFVSNVKILNANLGFTALLPFAQNRIEGNTINSKNSFAVSDLYLQPVQLGWHNKLSDFNFSYGLYIPTGKYELGGDGNSGLGMLINEFSGGTTLRFGPAGAFSFSTALSYELHSKKRGTDIKPGDIVSVEGGIGKTWYTFNGGKTPSSIIKAGVIYYMQLKATSDKIPVNNTIFSPGEDHTHALGLESNILLTKSRMLFGLRLLDEFGAVNRFQGSTVFITVAHIFSTAH